jgi:hypothetical protein
VTLASSDGGRSPSLLITESAAKKVYRIPVDLAGLKPDGARMETVDLKALELRSPSDCAELAGDRLVLADAGQLYFFRRSGNAYAVESEWTNANGPGGALGSQLRIAAYGDWLLVSDTQRHRVLWLDSRTRVVLAQFGQADRAGDGESKLNRPTLVAMNGTRAVIADWLNQRLVKVELRQ